MDWKTIRILGGVGSILTLVPYVNFVGWVLVVIAMYGISKKTGNKKIFNYYLISVVFGVAATILFIVSIFSLALIPSATNGGSGSYAMLILMAIIFIGILIVSAYFIKKSFIEVSNETHVDSFKTAGNLMFWGAITSIVLVGLVLYFIGYIMEIVSFFSLPDELLPPEPDKAFEKEISESEA